MRSRDETEIEKEVVDLDDSDTSEKGPQGIKIELRNISFKYPTRDVPVLKNLNMTVSFPLKF